MGTAASARLASDKAERMMEAELHARPKPEAVARLVASHGRDAARTRWWYVNERTFGTLLRVGRINLGWDAPSGNGRKSSTPPEVSLAIVATAVVIGSASVADRAGGVHAGATLFACEARGVKAPGSLVHLKSARGHESRRAAIGDAAAIAAIADRHAHERAVYAVVRAALALVPYQPATGPVLMPEAGPDLAAALAGHDPAAIEAVFPGLATNPVPTPKPEPAIEEQTVSQPDRAARPRKAPSEAAVREACAATPAPSRADRAERWGMTPSGVSQVLRRLGIELPKRKPGGSKPGRRKQTSAHIVALSLVPPVPAPAPDPAPVSEPVEIATLAIIAIPGQPALMRPLNIEELAQAFGLARMTGMDGRDALTWIRADLALVKAEYARRQA